MSANHQGGLTSPRSGRDVTQRFHRLLPPGERDVPTFAARRHRAVPALTLQRCMNPDCPNTCAWPVRGRPGYFCSRECRRWYVYVRTELLQDVKALSESAAEPGGTYEQRRQLESELAQRRWVLQRYLFEPTTWSSSGEQPDGGDADEPDDLADRGVDPLGGAMVGRDGGR